MPLVELTQADIVDIELAGAIGQRRLTAKTFVKRAAGLALVGQVYLHCALTMASTFCDIMCLEHGAVMNSFTTYI